MLWWNAVYLRGFYFSWVKKVITKRIYRHVLPIGLIRIVYLLCHKQVIPVELMHMIYTYLLVLSCRYGGTDVHVAVRELAGTPGTVQSAVGGFRVSTGSGSGLLASPAGHWAQTIPWPRTPRPVNCVGNISRWNFMRVGGPWPFLDFGYLP